MSKVGLWAYLYRSARQNPMSLLPQSCKFVCIHMCMYVYADIYIYIIYIHMQAQIASENWNRKHNPAKRWMYRCARASRRCALWRWYWRPERAAARCNVLKRQWVSGQVPIHANISNKIASYHSFRVTYSICRISYCRFIELLSTTGCQFVSVCVVPCFIKLIIWNYIRSGVSSHKLNGFYFLGPYCTSEIFCILRFFVFDLFLKVVPNCFLFFWGLCPPPARLLVYRVTNILESTFLSFFVCFLLGWRNPNSIIGL